MTSLFLSYARSDDEPFVRRLHDRLSAAGFRVWFDRISMPSRQLTFYQEIRDAIAACDRLVLVVGPIAMASDYVNQEWRFAYFESLKCVNPIVRLDGRDAPGQRIEGYSLVPRELALIHTEDFRRDAEFEEHLANLIRQLSEPLPPAGKLVAVPDLPPHFVSYPDRIEKLRDILLSDLKRPVVVSGAAGRLGLQGMGGIGKSVLASALAQHPEVRRAFPDGVYWVTLGQHPQLEELQQKLLKALGNEGIFTGVEAGKQKLREILSGRAALLVLDDAWQRPHAEAFNVVSGSSRLLLTTRDAGLVTALATNESHYQVQLPTLAEAEMLLARAAGKTDPLPLEARQVIEQCGRLPLALALCGGMARGVPWTDILEALHEHDLHYISTDHALEVQHADLWRVIDVSIHILGDDEPKRFTELAVFALDAGVPEAAILTLWEHTASLSARHARKLLAKFVDRSLVERGQRDGHIHLHDLVHNYATAMAEKLFGSMSVLHQRLLDSYLKKCPDGWSTGPNDGYFFENLFKHLIAAGTAREAVALLMNALWLQIKCNHRMVPSLQCDFERITAAIGAELKISQEQREALSLIDGALRLSAHVLVRDSGQFASQITGRLILHSEKLAVHAFVEQVEKAGPKPWLRYFHPSLEQAGGPLIRTLLGHTRQVNGVALSGDGRIAVSASDDQMLKVWDVKTGCELHTLTGHTEGVNAVALSEDGRLAVSASDDITLKVWDVEIGREIQTLTGHTSWVNGVALSRDGRLAVSASMDNTLKVWDVETGRQRCTLTGHTSWVNGVALSRDGRLAISASRDKTLKVWNVETGREVKTLTGHSEGVNTVALSEDGRFAVSASDDGTLMVWDIETGRKLETFRGHAGKVTGVALSGDGRLVVSAAEDRTLKLWDTKTGRELSTLTGHSSMVRSVALNEGERLAVSASDDETLMVWSLDGGREVRTCAAHTGPISGEAITGDGRLALSASWDTTLKVWDTETGHELRTLIGHKHFVCGDVLSGDGRLAVSASMDDTLKVWDVETGRQRHTLTGHANTVNGVALSEDGRIAVSASWDHTIKVWDVDTGCELRTLKGHSGEVCGVAVDRKGRRAVSAAWDNTLKVWDVGTGRELHTLTGHTEGVNSVVLSNDGRLAVSASWDKTLRVWDVDTGRELRKLAGHSGWVHGVALDCYGQLAASASSDGTIKVWNVETGVCIVTFACDCEARCVAFINPRRLLGGDVRGRQHWLELVE